MTYTRVGFWKSFVFFSFLPILLNPGAIWGQVRPRIVQRVDNEQRVTLKGNVHPMATVQSDRGAISDAQPIGRILLLLKRSDEQQAALSSFMEQQQDKSSPNYHHWLAPAEFGAQYGVADEDIQAVTQWLTQQGFQVNQVYSSKMEIEFSGNAAQVRTTFGTELRNFQLGGKTYVANSADPQIPAALAPVIAGIVSLNNFPRQSHARYLGHFRREKGQSAAEPLFTFPYLFGSPFYALGPGDFATIYNSKPLIAAGNDGTGQTIAVVGETNINLQDVQSFRQMFSLPNTFTSANVILNGEDPGITSTDEETEADLDVQWSGAVAPGATVQFVVSASTPASAGIDLSALYIIEHNLAAVMSESYGACEQALGAAGNSFYNSLWEQAAAQGITVVLSSGDGGSAGCDNFNAEQFATLGLAVSGFASTPFNVSVGGTDFDQMTQPSTYWNPTNDPATGTSVKGYIPEIPWNETCAQFATNSCTNSPSNYLNIVAGSGGPSTKYSKPSWQMGVTGMPNDSKRDQPDISLFASPGFNGTGYIVCQQDRNTSSASSCSLSPDNGTRYSFEIIGGTSASAPAFAGVIALVNQYEMNHGGLSRQGNANYTLYGLAKKPGASCASAVGEAAGCVFNDVTHGNGGFTGSVGTNSVPCQESTTNCSASTPGNVGVLVDSGAKEAWSTTAGYDMVTGLGTVNIQNLAQNWGGVSTVPTTTTLTLNPTTGITHGPAENVGVNITVKPTSGIATGSVSLLANLPDGSTRGVDSFSLTNGSLSATKTRNLPGGTYPVYAHYTGDGTNAPSDSAPVTVTVAPETSQTFLVIPSFDLAGSLVSGDASTVTYGTRYIIRMYVSDKNAKAAAGGPPSSTCDQVNVFTCPTGTVILSANGNPVDGGTFSLNNAGYTRDLVPSLATGTYSLLANYSGDSSFTGSAAAAHPFSITVAPTRIDPPEVLSLVPVIIGSQITLRTQVNTSVYAGVAPTGTVTFYDGNTLLPGTVTLFGNPGQSLSAASLAASIPVTFTTTGQHVLSAKYSGDTNYAATTSVTLSIGAVNATTMTQKESSTSVNFGQSVTVTSAVVSTSKTPVMTGTFAINVDHQVLSGSTIVASTDVNGNQLLTATATFTPNGSATVYSQYQGDQNYASASTGIDFVNVNIPDFSMPPSVNLTVSAGDTGTAMIPITPATNTASPVTLTLNGASNQPFAGATLSFNPTTVTLNGSAVPVTVSLSTTPPSPASQSVSQMQIKRSALFAFSRAGWWSAAVTSAAMLLFLMGSPGRMRRYRAAFFAATVCLFSFAMGCGGGGGSSGGGGGGGGVVQVPSTTTISSSTTKVTPGSPYTLTAKVGSSKTPSGGIVTFMAAGSPVGTASLVNGQASFTSMVPIGLGTYNFSAAYSGDTNNLSSQSASGVNIAFTGSTSITVYGQTGTLQRATQLNITLQ